MATVKSISALILFFLLTSADLIPAFEAAAYIPHYRLEFLPGAENLLGRPTYNTEPNAWDGRETVRSDALGDGSGSQASKHPYYL